MKGDRFDVLAHNVVQKLMGCEAFELTAASLDMVWGSEKLVVALLRKENQAVRMMVKNIQVPIGVNPSSYIHALKDILAALDKRAKGGRK